MSRKAILLTTIFALTLSAAGNLIAGAQQQSTKKTATGQPTPKPDRSQWESKDNGNLDAESMREPVSLPNLPAFTGHAKFMTGVAHKGEFGNSWVMRFETKEDQKLVLDWYKNTLNMYKWKMNFADDTTVMGKLNGATCAVVVNNISARKKPNLAEVEINYFQGKQ